MTLDIQSLLLVTIPPTIVAVGGIITSIYHDRRANTKLDHITVLTNSTLTTANNRIGDLERIIQDLLVAARAKK